MSRQSVNSKIDGDAKNRWNDFLVDVGAEIEKTKKRLSDLEESKRIAEMKIQKNEPFPYTEAISTHL